MFRRYTLLLICLIFASCSAAIDTPVDSGTAYLGKWRLTKLDGVAFVARPLRLKNHGNKPAAVSPVAAFAMIQFRADGRFTGTAGCNHLFGRQQQVYPNFNLDPIGATRMACSTSAERLFVDALSVMIKARRADEILILSNNSGREMLFSRY